jgi:hypothetical protein
MVPIIVAVGCFVAGAAAAARWLPGLAEGLVGGMAFFVVCGLISAGLGLIGVDIYVIVKGLEGAGWGRGINSTILADGLASLLRDGGTLFGLAGIFYLLAPSPDRGPAVGHPSAPSSGES